MVQESTPNHAFSFWLSEFKEGGLETSSKNDEPNYFLQEPDSLLTGANKIHAFMAGTGLSIFEQLQPTIEQAEQELVIITCFWSSSKSQAVLIESLKRLSGKALRNGRHKIKVFIGLSSLSYLQKLFQTSSLAGHTYPQSEWRKLELSEDDFPGLDLTVKSIFVRPFSVMHPKFVIVDRKLVCLPSCNVSWEDWFEGAVVMSGAIVENFTRFWQEFWLQGRSPLPELESTSSIEFAPAEFKPTNHYISHFKTPLPSIEACFLPSPHHANPHFHPFPFQSPAQPRPTPLNHFLLSHILNAEGTIYIQSPNLTCLPVITELLSALGRGVDVHIVTTERLMLLEQLVTAGTLTSWCVNSLIRDYEALVVRTRHRDDEETGLREPGHLTVEYFMPRIGAADGEPVKSHIKVSIFDDRVIVLGSGNMDRASWYTSQELGVALQSKELVEAVKKTLKEGLKDRKELRYSSRTGNED